MAGKNIKKEEYEVLSYPKLNHVKASIVQIINRNTHVHRALEMGLALAGEGYVRVGDNTFPIRKHSLFFFNANEPHEIFASSQEGIRIAYLQVASSFCSEYMSWFRNLEIPCNDLSAALKQEDLREVTGLMVRTISDYMDSSTERQTLRCITDVCQLYTKLLDCLPYRLMEEAAYLSRSKKMARLNRITEYIDTNYPEKITLEDLAKREDVSTTYLSHFIRDNLHVTFQEYISSVRFERALKLLRSSSMCLTDVSVVCGFSAVQYLSRMLETHFGIPAQQCREQLRQQIPEPQPTQAQVFASEEIGRNWLRDYWEQYSKN